MRIPIAALILWSSYMIIIHWWCVIIFRKMSPLSNPSPGNREWDVARKRPLTRAQGSLVRLYSCVVNCVRTVSILIVRSVVFCNCEAVRWWALTVAWNCLIVALRMNCRVHRYDCENYFITIRGWWNTPSLRTVQYTVILCERCDD